MATIVIFASSLALALILVLFRTFEIKYGKNNFVLGGLRRIDTKSEKLISILKFKWLQISQSLRYIVSVQMKEYFKNLFKKLEEKVIEQYKIKQSTIMGQKQIPSNGSASFYLKKISEDKENTKKGKINDETIDLVSKE
jgi:hypothetical protein